MPWCPQCQYEYVDGIEVCPECAVPMVEELPDEEPLEKDGLLGLSFVPVNLKDPLAFLYAAPNDSQADQLAALLRSGGIPVLKNHTDRQAFLKYYTGRAPGGADLLVPERCLEAAREMLGLNDDSVPYLYRRADYVEPSEEETE